MLRLSQLLNVQDVNLEILYYIRVRNARKNKLRVTGCKVQIEIASVVSIPCNDNIDRRDACPTV
jgi:hypothetical protein